MPPQVGADRVQVGVSEPRLAAQRVLVVDGEREERFLGRNVRRRHGRDGHEQSLQFTVPIEHGYSQASEAVGEGRQRELRNGRAPRFDGQNLLVCC